MNEFIELRNTFCLKDNPVVHYATILFQYPLSGKLGIVGVGGEVKRGIERCPADTKCLTNAVCLSPWDSYTRYFSCHNNIFIDKCL